MSDLIDRQAAIEAIEFGITYAKAVNRETGEVTELFKQSNDELKKAIERIRQLPSGEQKAGKWLKAYGDHEAFGVRPFYRYCSACNESTVFPYNYCPNCGAYMMGESNEAD